MLTTIYIITLQRQRIFTYYKTVYLIILSILFITLFAQLMQILIKMWFCIASDLSKGSDNVLTTIFLMFDSAVIACKCKRTCTWFWLMLEQNLRNAKTCGVLFCSFYGNVCLFLWLGSHTTLKINCDTRFLLVSCFRVCRPADCCCCFCSFLRVCKNSAGYLCVGSWMCFHISQTL